MRPATLRVAPHQDLVRGVEKKHFGAEAGEFQLVEDTGPLWKEEPLARVDAERYASEVGVALRRQPHHRLGQRDRHIVDAVEAQVLEHPHRGQAPGARYAGDDDQTRIARRRGGSGGVDGVASLSRSAGLIGAAGLAGSVGFAGSGCG
jgi:hypothetical protein